MTNELNTNMSNFVAFIPRELILEGRPELASHDAKRVRKYSNNTIKTGL